MRYTKQPPGRAPRIGGTKGAAPVASTRTSYSWMLTPPGWASRSSTAEGGDTTVTVRADRSISVTTLSMTSRTRGSSYAPPGRRESDSAPPSAWPNQLVSPTRLYAARGSSPNDEHVVGLGEATLDRGLGEPVAHHAVPDDDDPLTLACAHDEDGREADVVGGVA